MTSLFLLFEATLMGDAEDVRRLIAKKGIDVSALDYSSSKQTLLHLAAWFGFADVVKVLLEAGADLAARDVCGRTPLHTAARGSYEEMVMLEAFKEGQRNSDVSAEDRVKVARLLLDAGAEVGASVQPAAGHGPQNGWTPLHCAAFNLHHSLVTLLLDRGADVHAKTSCHEQTALYFAVDRKDEKLVRLLVDRGADLDATDRSHILPLHEAIWNGSAKMIKLLADLGANLEASDNGSTVLHLAVYQSTHTAVRALLQSRADVGARDAQENTPLHKATIKRRGLAGEKVVRTLLDHGADLSCVNTDGNSSLHLAAMHLRDNSGVVRLLIDAGANVWAKNNRGDTPRALVHIVPSGWFLRAAEHRDLSLAFAMGHQERLGAASLVRGLEPEVVRMVLDLV